MEVEGEGGRKALKLAHLVRKVLECVFYPSWRVLLGSLEELVRQASDEGLEEAHGAEYLLSFGCVLWRVVDTLVGSAEAVEERKKTYPYRSDRFYWSSMTMGRIQHCISFLRIEKKVAQIWFENWATLYCNEICGDSGRSSTQLLSYSCNNILWEDQ